MGFANINSSITSSYATGVVTGESSVGGLVGYAEYSEITSSYATGAITGNNRVGGLVGYTYRANITSSYATGAVTGAAEAVGGLVGFAEDSEVTSSYAIGALTDSTIPGGLVGHGVDSTFSSLYWATDSSGQSEGLFLDEGNTGVDQLIGATLAELQCPTAANNTDDCLSGETLYDGWDAIDHDNDAETDPISPWVFGDSSTLPILDWQ